MEIPGRQALTGLLSRVAGAMAFDNPEWTETAERQVEDTAELLESVDWSGKQVLDVGCWWGWLVQYASERGARVTGFDRDDGHIRDAMAYLRSAQGLCVADALRMPYASETFDVIVSIHTMEHVHPEQGMVAEIRRVLKPDGVLLLSVPNDWSFGVLPYRPFRFALRGGLGSGLPRRLHLHLKSICYSDVGHHREYTVRSVTELLRLNRFEVERVWRHGWEMPYPLKGRLSKKTRQRLSRSLGKSLPGILRASISIRARKTTEEPGVT